MHPDAKLADAQRALAREYGFATWSALKGHVESQSRAEAPASETMHVAGSPFSGTWTAKVSESTRPPDNPYRSATLLFSVRDNTVIIVDVVVDESGRQERTTNTLIVDGREHRQEHGYAVTATWLSSRSLQAVVTKNGHIEGRITYEVAPDGKTLNLVAGAYMSVFERVREASIRDVESESRP